MGKFVLLSALMVTTIGIVGCSSDSSSAAPNSAPERLIGIGMTEAEVKERLGESKTSFVVNGSFWHRPEWSKEENEEYQRRLTHSGLVYEDLEVRFDQDGRVLRIDKLINGKPPAD